MNALSNIGSRHQRRGEYCVEEIAEWGANQEPTTFKDLSRARGMATNGDDLDMELENVSLIQGSSS